MRKDGMSDCASALFLCLQRDALSVLTDWQIRFVIDNPAVSVWPDASYEEVAMVSLIRSFYKKFVDGTADDAEAKALRTFSEVNERCKNHSMQPASERMAELFGTFKRNVYEFFYPRGSDRTFPGGTGSSSGTDRPHRGRRDQRGSVLPAHSMSLRERIGGATSGIGTQNLLNPPSFLARGLRERDCSSDGDSDVARSLGPDPDDHAGKAGRLETGSPRALLWSFDQIASYGSTGPGSSNGSRGTDFYTKLFDGPLGCTSETLYLAYSNYLSTFPLWQDAENRRFDSWGGAKVVAGNKLYFVPKNRDVSRTICSEPVLNMFFQLGVGRILEQRLNRTFGVDLSSQPQKNRELARLGSLDGSFCTIDLSSASDSLSLSMIEEVIPRDQLAWFKILRSRVAELPDGGEIELNMLSTMGNGYTFPLQTMLFSCVVAAAYEWRGIKRVNPYGKALGNWAVFGDDIIVLKEVFNDVVDLLALLGFQVNRDKTFSEGWFRESCGADFFKGRPVRGVYIKSLRSPQDRYVAINRLNQWSSDTGIRLPHTVGFLARTVRFLPIPYEENDDAGIKVPSSLVATKQLCRFTGSIVYERCVARATKLRIKDLEIRTPKGVRRRLYNAEGLLLSFLRGDIKGHTISIRHGAVKYATKRSVCPNWDYRKIDFPLVWRESNRAPVVSPFDTWRRWESAALDNLLSRV